MFGHEVHVDLRCSITLLCRQLSSLFVGFFSSSPESRPLNQGCCGWLCGTRPAMAEPVPVRPVGVTRTRGAWTPPRRGAGMHVGGVQVADAGVVVLGVVPGHEAAHPRPSVVEALEVGAVLGRLEVRLGVGLSFEVRGRGRLRVVPRSSRSSAMDFEVIWACQQRPRSECRVRVSGSTPSRSARRISRRATCRTRRCRPPAHDLRLQMSSTT